MSLVLNLNAPEQWCDQHGVLSAELFADCRAALTNGDGQDDDELEAKAADGVTYQNCCAASRLGPTDAN